MCSHKNLANPPAGKNLRICLDCDRKIVECSSCDAMVVASPDDEGWMTYGTVVPQSDHNDVFKKYACPTCWNRINR